MQIMVHFQVVISSLGLAGNGALPDSVTFAPTSLGGLSGDFSIVRFEKQIRGENETIKAAEYVVRE
jgi:hypothetical protein